MLLVFNWSQAQYFHRKEVVFISSIIKSLIWNWPLLGLADFKLTSDAKIQPAFTGREGSWLFLPWSCVGHTTSNLYALIGQNLTGEFSRKIYATSAILFPSLQYSWRLGFLKACFFSTFFLTFWVPTLGTLSPSSSLMNSVVLSSRRCSLWTDLPRRPLCLEGYSTNKAIFSRNQSVNSCLGHFPLESCGWIMWEEEHEKMQCKPSLRWDSHSIYSDVSEGWKWCDPYPSPLDINCSIFCQHWPMRWHWQTRHFPRTLSPSWCPLVSQIYCPGTKRVLSGPALNEYPGRSILIKGCWSTLILVSLKPVNKRGKRSSKNMLIKPQNSLTNFWYCIFKLAPKEVKKHQLSRWFMLSDGKVEYFYPVRGTGSAIRKFRTITHNYFRILFH